MLFVRIKKLVATERRIGVEILECLYEIERRKAYAELHYDGLYSYCVKELKFTDSQAYQRIQAMRALREIPELKSMIESGSLSVSSVSKVQTHLRQEEKSGAVRKTPEKHDLYQSMANCTSREVEIKLAEMRGEKIGKKLVLELDEDLQELWSQVKNFAAHRTGGEEAEVLRMLVTDWLGRHDPTHERAQRAVPLSTRHSSSRYIRASTRKEVWKRDSAECGNCGSKYALEMDHKRPFPLGGKNTKENLRLLCRSCNQFAAIQVFGVRKVERARVGK